MKSRLNPLLSKVGSLLFAVIHFFTGVAGFWVRRIWANAAIFAAIWVLLAMVADSVDKYIQLWMFRSTDVFEFPSFYAHIQALYMVLAIGLAFVSSAALRRRTVIPCSRWLANPFVGVCLGLAAIYLTYPAIRARADWLGIYLTQGGLMIGHTPSGKPYPHYFHGDVYLANPSTWGELSFLPYFRDGKIRGQLLRAGKPVQGLVHAYLNDYYRTPWVMSDNDGYFLLPAPHGQWEINRVEVSLKLQKPQPEPEVLTILDGEGKTIPCKEALFGDIECQKRIKVQAKVQANGVSLNLDIVPYISMLWPEYDKQGQVDLHKPPQIRWKPILNASHYCVTLYEQPYTSSGSAVIEPILQRKVNEPSLVISPQLTTAASGQKYDYIVDVRAFDENDHLLTISRETFGRSSFFLEDDLRMVHEKRGSCPNP